MVIDGRHQQWQKGKTKIYKVRNKNVKEREKHAAKLMIHKKWKKVKFSNWKCWFQKQIFNKEQMFCSHKAVALFLHFHYNFLTNTPQLYINCDCTMTPTYESHSTWQEDAIESRSCRLPWFHTWCLTFTQAVLSAC